MSIRFHIPGRLYIHFSCCLSYVFLGSLFFLSIHFVYVIWRRRLVVLSFGTECSGVSRLSILSFRAIKKKEQASLFGITDFVLLCSCFLHPLQPFLTFVITNSPFECLLNQVDQCILYPASI